MRERRSARGDLLIGADGVKSAVRRQMAGDAPTTYTGDCAWRITLPVEDLPADFLPQVMSVFMGPGAHVVCYYLRAGKLLNFVGLVETDDVSEESWTAKFPWENLKADFEGWNDKIQTIIDTADHDKCYRWSLHYRPPIDNWSTGRTTMLGDSVHATLPYLAQGACMAIEDGAVLTQRWIFATIFRTRCSSISATGWSARPRSLSSPTPIALCSTCRAWKLSAPISPRSTKAPTATAGSIPTIH